MILDAPVVGRYLKIKPFTWNEGINFRAGLIIGDPFV
jgi:hypothetical protein